jgi:teichuronic acid biosynthesis glycosyltransferase TuaC
MRVLALTNMYPHEGNPSYGTFVKSQIDLVREYGVEVDVLFINGLQSKWRYLRGVYDLHRCIARKHYDLIHAHYVFCGIIARLQWKLPILLTHHGVEVLISYQAGLSKVITPLVDRVIVRSREMQDRLKSNNVSVVPSGIDMTLFRPMPKEVCRRQLGLPPDKRLVLFAGALKSVKRIELIRQAMALVQLQESGAELVVATQQPHDRIPVYMNACDTLVLASMAEGSPNVVKEAMACDLPIVSTAVGDVAELVGGVPGCYISESRPEDLAAKLVLALRFGRRTRGRERLLRLGLDSHTIARRILAIYEEMLQAQHRLQLRHIDFAGSIAPSGGVEMDPESDVIRNKDG